MTVSGTVTDKAGEPLPGITVVVKGPTQGTVINADGEYYPALICTKGIRNSFLNTIFVNSWTVKTSSRAYYDYQIFKHNICVNTGPYSEYYVDNRNT